MFGLSFMLCCLCYGCNCMASTSMPCLELKTRPRFCPVSSTLWFEGSNLVAAGISRNSNREEKIMVVSFKFFASWCGACSSRAAEKSPHNSMFNGSNLGHPKTVVEKSFAWMSWRLSFAVNFVKKNWIVIFPHQNISFVKNFFSFKTQSCKTFLVGNKLEW